MPSIASRLSRIKPSPILAVVAKAAALRKTGLTIIDLSIGEPDFKGDVLKAFCKETGKLCPKAK